MLIGQGGSTGGSTRQEVEVGQGEQEDSGKKEALPPVQPRSRKKQDVICLAEKGTEPCG